MGSIERWCGGDVDLGLDGREKGKFKSLTSVTSGKHPAASSRKLQQNGVVTLATGKLYFGF